MKYTEYERLECPKCHPHDVTPKCLKPMSIDRFPDGIAVYFYCEGCGRISQQFLREENIVYKFKKEEE